MYSRASRIRPVHRLREYEVGRKDFPFPNDWVRPVFRLPIDLVEHFQHVCHAMKRPSELEVNNTLESLQELPSSTPPDSFQPSGEWCYRKTLQELMDEQYYGEWGGLGCKVESFLNGEDSAHTEWKGSPKLRKRFPLRSQVWRDFEDACSREGRSVNDEMQILLKARSSISPILDPQLSNNALDEWKSRSLVVPRYLLKKLGD